MDFAVGGWLEMKSVRWAKRRMLILGHDEGRIWNLLCLTNLSPITIMKRERIVDEAYSVE